MLGSLEDDDFPRSRTGEAIGVLHRLGQGRDLLPEEILTVRRQPGGEAVPELIALASTFYTLYPGDVIFTGTPDGVSPIEAGDELVATIEGVGTMQTRVRAGEAAPVVASKVAALGGA